MNLYLPWSVTLSLDGFGILNDRIYSYSTCMWSIITRFIYFIFKNNILTYSFLCPYPDSFHSHHSFSNSPTNLFQHHQFMQQFNLIGFFNFGSIDTSYCFINYLICLHSDFHFFSFVIYLSERAGYL